MRGDIMTENIVTLRKSGNSRVFTVPSNYEGELGSKYKVTIKNRSISYTPKDHVNVFSTKEWREFDYQKVMEEDVELSDVKPVGKEIL